MRLKEYARNPQRRKEYVQQPGLLLVGIDVSKTKHDACIGTQERVLIAMEPSGIYWHGLYDRLRRCGYGVCLVNCPAVHHNRKTMHDGASKTDEKDAQAVFDLLVQGKCFLPVERDVELKAA